MVTTWRGHPYWISVAFFLMLTAMGAWVPSLANIMKEKGAGGLVPLAFLAWPVMSLISPLFWGALADRKVEAQKLLAVLVMLSAVVLFVAFWQFGQGLKAKWFVLLLFIAAGLSAPTFSLLTQIGLTHAKDQESGFARFRVWGTIGWVFGGAMISFVFKADSEIWAGLFAGVLRFVMGLICFFLPATPPRGAGKDHDWKSVMGLKGYALLKERNMMALVVTTVLVSIPLSSFYMYTPVHLKDLGFERATGILTVGQLIEVAVMLSMGFILKRFRIKTVLLCAAMISGVRFSLFAVSGYTDTSWTMISGAAFHGVAYTLFFITGQIYMQKRVEAGVRSQAQALLSVATGGVGTLIGTSLCGVLYRFFVDTKGDWGGFWLSLTAVSAVSVLFLFFAYQSQKVVPKKESVK